MTYFTEISEKKKPLTELEKTMLAQVVERHYGPGPHPGTGTSQDVHGGNGTSREKNIRIYPNIGESGRAGWIFTDEELAERMKMVEDQWGLYAATNIDQSPSSSWMMPDGRVTVKLTEHEDLVALIGKYENLFASGFVRINIVKIKHGSTGAMSQYPPTIIHFQFDSRALNSKTRQAMSDVFWAMHYPKGEYKGTPGLGIDYWDAMGNEQAIRDPVSRMTIVGPEEFKRELGWRIDKSLIKRHYGPGPHPGTGTSQDVHGGGGKTIRLPDDEQSLERLREQAKERQAEGNFALVTRDPETGEYILITDRETAIKDTGDKIRNLNREQLYHFNAYELFYQKQGDSTSVNISALEMGDLRGFGQEAHWHGDTVVSIHNHPPTSGETMPPSPSDLRVAALTYTHETWISTSEGDYIVKLAKFGRFTAHELSKAFRAYNDEVLPKLFPEINKEMSPRAQRQYLRENDLFEELKQFQLDRLDAISEELPWVSYEYRPIN